MIVCLDRSVMLMSPVDLSWWVYSPSSWKNQGKWFELELAALPYSILSSWWIIYKETFYLRLFFLAPHLSPFLYSLPLVLSTTSSLRSIMRFTSIIVMTTAVATALVSSLTSALCYQPTVSNEEENRMSLLQLTRLDRLCIMSVMQNYYSSLTKTVTVGP